jgi:hypothetical protein
MVIASVRFSLSAGAFCAEEGPAAHDRATKKIRTNSLDLHKEHLKKY